MRSIKRFFAFALAAALMLQNLPVYAEATENPDVTAPSAIEETLEGSEGSEDPENPEDQTEQEGFENLEDQTESEDSENSGSPEDQTEPEDSENSEEQAEQVISDEAQEPGESDDSEDQTEAAEDAEDASEVPAPVIFNTGNFKAWVVDAEKLQNAREAGFDPMKEWGAPEDLDTRTDSFDEDGNYTIEIPERNPFFPYEVQFTYQGETWEEWIMDPDDTVEVGGHTFSVSASFDNETVTQMSLSVGGDEIVVYPERKTFTDGGAAAYSLLPLTNGGTLSTVDLSEYTPAELTMVSVSELITGLTLQEADKVMWTYKGDDDYDISGKGDQIDLSYSSSSSTTLEFIIGAADQLEGSNKRYELPIKLTYSYEWLKPVFYTQAEDGTRTQKTISDYDYYSSKKNQMHELYASVCVDAAEEEAPLYCSFEIDSSVYSSTVFKSVKIYAGEYATAAEAAASGSEDITDKIFGVADMDVKDAGYSLNRYSTWVTMVTYDESGNVTGCLPLLIYAYRNVNEVDIHTGMYKDSNKTTRVSYSYGYGYSGSLTTITWTLENGYAADASYYLTMSFTKSGTDCSSEVSAIYVGSELYDSAEAAKSANAVDVKNQLFGLDGYLANYSQGVYFTVIFGTDGSDQSVHHYCVEVSEEAVDELFSSNTAVQFTGLKDGSSNEVSAYVVSQNDDSYGENNYITFLVGTGTNLTNLAPVFSCEGTIKLYTGGSDSPEVSGTSKHDFSGGAVLYTASAEDKENSKNYWVRVVQATSGAGWLYINSIYEDSEKAEAKGTPVVTTREVILDDYHDNRHDIFLANMGSESLGALSVTLESEVLELDQYWTLTGNSDLKGFSDSDLTGDGLQNLAKIRLKVKDSVEDGTDVSGTLTISSGSNVLVTMTLTGTVGNPSIVTEKIPDAVKYVSYGTMIQNNNKYSWNKTEYTLYSGSLPEGMELKPNGELYGVPKGTGTFSFVVKMENSLSTFSSDYQSLTLKVKSNTDANVDAETDENYDVLDRIPNMIEGSAALDENQIFRSNGVYTEFQAEDANGVFLDGEQLTPDVDYNSESGSTKITIMSQTLKTAGRGTHTLSVEFRDSDNTLKKAAQNFTISAAGSSDNGSSSDSGSGGSSSGVGSSNSGGSGSSSSGGSGSSNSGGSGSAATSAISYVNNMATPQIYTVVSGDSLWKIAAKFYGDGSYWTRIFLDNQNIISNPNRIFVGMQLLINPIQMVTATAGTAASGTQISGGNYTVVSGDSLWKIAQRAYGTGREWRKIYEANRSTISAPEMIHVGQILMIPE